MTITVTGNDYRDVIQKLNLDDNNYWHFSIRVIQEYEDYGRKPIGEKKYRLTCRPSQNETINEYDSLEAVFNAIRESVKKQDEKYFATHNPHSS